MDEKLKEELILFLETCLLGSFRDDDYRYGYECNHRNGFRAWNDNDLVHDDDCEAMLLYKKLTSLE